MKLLSILKERKFANVTEEAKMAFKVRHSSLLGLLVLMSLFTACTSIQTKEIKDNSKAEEQEQRDQLMLREFMGHRN